MDVVGEGGTLAFFSWRPLWTTFRAACRWRQDASRGSRPGWAGCRRPPRPYRLCEGEPPHLNNHVFPDQVRPPTHPADGNLSAVYIYIYTYICIYRVNTTAPISNPIILILIVLSGSSTYASGWWNPVGYIYIYIYTYTCIYRVNTTAPISNPCILFIIVLQVRPRTYPADGNLSAIYIYMHICIYMYISG